MITTLQFKQRKLKFDKSSIKGPHSYHQPFRGNKREIALNQKILPQEEGGMERNWVRVMIRLERC